MKRPMLKKIAIALLFAVLSFSADSTFARDACMGWVHARPIISKEGLVPLRDVRQTVKRKYGGKLIRAKLCERKGRYVYDITVLGPRGKVKSVTVNGRTGQHMMAHDTGRQGIMPSSAAGAGVLKKGKFKFKMPKFWKKKKR